MKVSIIFQNLNMIQALFIRFLVEYFISGPKCSRDWEPGPWASSAGACEIGEYNYCSWQEEAWWITCITVVINSDHQDETPSSILWPGWVFNLITIIILALKNQRHFQTIATLVGQINAWTKDLTLNISKIILCCSAGHFSSNQWGI